MYGHRETVSLLLKAHASVNALDVRCAAALRFHQTSHLTMLCIGQTPLDLCLDRYPEIERMLIDAGSREGRDLFNPHDHLADDDDSTSA